MEQPLHPLRKLLRPVRAKNRLRLLGLLLVWLLALPGLAQGPMSVVELVDMEKKLQPGKLQKLCQQKGYPDVGIYRWISQDSPMRITHMVAYGPANQIRQLLPLAKKAYASAGVKIYDAPFYQFDRQRCPDKTTAKQWDNILLTCNLVEDKAKQQEYMQYHAMQFEQWPEVATGFCNASFQQLLVFRQGRQLMLVISIPKGQSLDELNPRTTQNNPRVDNWNALMKQYQTGLPGTKPGEAWVFLTPVAPIRQLAPSKIQQENKNVMQRR